MKTGTTAKQLFMKQDGVFVNASPLQICEIASEYIARSAKMKGDVMSSPETVREFLKTRLSLLEREHFGVIWLDNRHQAISFEILSEGTIDCAPVYPREVIKRGLEVNAAACIICHNHPSNIPEPSDADRRITRRLVDAFNLIDMRLLDHIVVGGDDTVSFAERGLI